MSTMSTSDTLRTLIQVDKPGWPNPYTSPTAFARAAIDSGELPATSVSVAEALIRRLTKELGPKRWILASDFHVPHVNTRLVENWLNYVDDVRPAGIGVMGDLLDCEMISRFPSGKRARTLQNEIDEAIDILDAIVDAAPGAELACLEGNHEERLRRHIGENPGLEGLRALTIPALLELGDDRPYEWVKYGASYDVGKLSMIHGHKVSKHSAYTAKAHLLDGDYSTVAHGHTHRLGAYYTTGHRGTRRAFEIGGFFDVKALDYVTGPKNWQNGFAVADVFPDGNVHIQLIEATVDGEFVADGKYYR